MGKAALAPLLILLQALAASGCGYHFQNSESPLVEREGIHRIYVRPLVNNTYKAGVENLVYNALLRTLAAHRRVVIVSTLERSDAVLEGTVNVAKSLASAAAAASNRNPVGLYPTDPLIQVASEYIAYLDCKFSLVRTSTIRRAADTAASAGKPELAVGGGVAGPRPIWSSSFNRIKPFPSANQIDVLGTTSSLINDSEFDRALGDLAHSMMEDVHESMLAQF